MMKVHPSSRTYNGVTTSVDNRKQEAERETNKLTSVPTVLLKCGFSTCKALNTVLPSCWTGGIRSTAYKIQAARVEKDPSLLGRLQARNMRKR